MVSTQHASRERICQALSQVAIYAPWGRVFANLSYFAKSFAKLLEGCFKCFCQKSRIPTPFAKLLEMLLGQLINYNGKVADLEMIKWGADFFFHSIPFFFLLFLLLSSQKWRRSPREGSINCSWGSRGPAPLIQYWIRFWMACPLWFTFLPNYLCRMLF